MPMAQSKKQLQNLKRGKATQFKSGDEAAKESGRKGGVASGEAKRKRRSLYESLDILLEKPLKKGKCVDIEDANSLEDLKEKSLTVQDGIIIAQLSRALKGDVKAAKFIQDVIDSAQNEEDTGGVQIIDDI